MVASYIATNWENFCHGEIMASDIWALDSNDLEYSQNVSEVIQRNVADICVYSVDHINS